MKNYGLYILFIVFSWYSCAPSAGEKNTFGTPLRAPEQILSNVMGFMSYRQDFLKLAVDYRTFDTALHPIDKAAFLEAFATGDYLPLRITGNDSAISYKLYKLPASTSKDVANTIRYYGEAQLKNFKREGDKFPAFSFSDVNGTVYNNDSLKNKTVVMKFWFIHCVSCVAEMPRLNELVAEYKDRKDVLFLSMAFDRKDQLVNFLKNTRFLYHTIPVPESFISEEVKVSGYPTHIILKDGMIKKIPDGAEELVDALEEEVPLK
ncbi:TlpA family protein disulfide reductase [Chitinophaga sp. 22321]|uniref:TlpA family protein disulfide reductase n=1 Tax=Chitinophaga hostae TaxID=2831022 RepID=A0ABS5J4K6_9BACT|nr:TlpA disulfide reductase family protein [Chitinophaga hostae]MBS0030010.1 TlpA family protein disulfide reductase [Chitinophaga hostae]